MSNAYHAFFKDSPAGEQFVEKLNQLIDSNHKKGEDDPIMSRDYAQRAKGIREVIDQINSLSVTSRKQLEADTTPQEQS